MSDSITARSSKGSPGTRTLAYLAFSLASKGPINLQLGDKDTKALWHFHQDDVGHDEAEDRCGKAVGEEGVDGAVEVAAQGQVQRGQRYFSEQNGSQ